MKRRRKVYRIFYALEEHLEIPMFLLALVWLYLFIREMVTGLTAFQQDLILIIWILFIAEFLVKLVTAPRRSRYIRDNWITIIALLVPALRIFRMFRALSILNSVRVVNSTKIIRAVTSGKRFLSSLREAQGPQPAPEMDVGFVLAYNNSENKEALHDFVQQLQKDVREELQSGSGMKWNFDVTDDLRLEEDATRRPSDFLDNATQRMAEGPYDLVAIITDVGLMSRNRTMIPGVSSSVSRVVVISTRKLTTTGKGQANLELTDSRVRAQGASLLLHLVARVFGLRKGLKKELETNGQISTYSPKERKELKERSKNLPDRELREGTWLESLIFHILMALRHPKELLVPLLKNKAIFLPLSLPGLATAAVAPGLILIFTAEIWDVGLGMTNQTATFFAVASILLASFYLVSVQSLFLPRKEKRILTEHLAVANSVIYLSIFLACVGLFLFLCSLMLILEFYVFPPDLMQTWPTLETGTIGFKEKLRLAVFISTVGVTTGALAGGLDKRTVIQHLALFKSRP